MSRKKELKHKAKNKKQGNLIQKPRNVVALERKVDNMVDKYEQTVNGSKFNKLADNILNVFRWILTGIFGTLILFMILNLIVSMSISMSNSVLQSLNILSNDYVIIATTAMVTSCSWALLTKFNLYKFIYKFFKKGIPTFNKDKGGS